MQYRGTTYYRPFIIEELLKTVMSMTVRSKSLEQKLHEGLAEQRLTMNRLEDLLLTQVCPFIISSDEMYQFDGFKKSTPP